jgi:hypothetical protein
MESGTFRATPHLFAAPQSRGNLSQLAPRTLELSAARRGCRPHGPFPEQQTLRERMIKTIL